MLNIIKLISIFVVFNSAWVQAEPKHFVFNLSGSFNGYGDVTGPLFTIMEFKKLHPHDNYTIITDERGEKIALETLNQGSTQSFKSEFGIDLVKKEHESQVKAADYSFELFYGGRKIKSLTEAPYIDAHTVNVISDTMHGHSLDEVRTGNSHIYFKPPGIGTERSGIVNNPDISLFKKYSGKDRRKITGDLFQGTILEKILNREQFPRAQVGFFYGAHNELHEPSLTGQTKKYVEALEAEQLKKDPNSQSPLLIFTPNTKEDLEKALRPSSIRVLTLDELKQAPQLENQPYIISLGNISNKQFTGLMAVSDLPVLVEGNTAVSTALRLNVPFMMYRSPWNDSQIKDLIGIESNYCRSNAFNDAYDLTCKTLPLFEQFIPRKKDNIFYQALAIRVPSLANKFSELVNAVEQMKEIQSQKMDPDQRGRQYSDLSQTIQAKTKDEILEYSVIYDAHQRNLIPETTLLSKRRDLERRGFDVVSIEKQFIPIRGGFSSEKQAIVEKTRPENQESLETKEVREKTADLKSRPKRELSDDHEVQDYLKKHKIYISLTTSPERISKLIHIINTLDLNNVEEVLINVPLKYGRNGSSYTIPPELEHHPKVRIIRPELDLGPITKLLPGIEYAKQKDPNSTVITIDDDTGYPNGFISELIYHSVHNEGSVVGGSGQDGKFWGFDNQLPAHAKKGSSACPADGDGVYHCDVVEGFGGIAYRPKYVNTDLMKRFSNREFSKDCFVSDDLVISYVLAHSGVDRIRVHNEYIGPSRQHQFSWGFGADALHKGAGLAGESASPSVEDVNTRKYQECLKKLKEALP